ncbi:MAG TPA: hypothetical protein VK473_11855, partial [Terriglobales bacterium]|nr:hypothetical protein [Terriglobales bacterium]
FYTTSLKTYEGQIRFGYATDTYDADGDPCGLQTVAALDLDQVRSAARRFQGRIQQMPPPFSAKKIKGVPAYKLARRQKPVSLEPVEVEVRQFEILKTEGDQAFFRAQVGSGTYMRSIAHEMGQALGVGAHLAQLRRVAVGEFGLDDAITLERLEACAQAGELEQVLVHPRKLLPEFPSVTADEESVGRIRHGHAVNLPEVSRAPRVKVFAGQRELIAIATRVAGTLFHPKVVLSGGA